MAELPARLHPSDTIGTNISTKERRHRSLGQTSFFDHDDHDQYRMSSDFRRQIKARSMEYGSRFRSCVNQR